MVKTADGVIQVFTQGAPEGWPEIDGQCKFAVHQLLCLGQVRPILLHGHGQLLGFSETEYLVCPDTSPGKVVVKPGVLPLSVQGLYQGLFSLWRISRQS